jgi:hypothetical protein
MYLTPEECLKLAYHYTANERLSSEAAEKISKAQNGITFILEFLFQWEKQDALHMFDWEHLAIQEWDFLEWIQQNQSWKWDRIPNDRIERAWFSYDMKR